MNKYFAIQSVWRRTSHVSSWIVLGIILLIAIRLALPFAVKHYVNHELNQAHDYTGQIRDVDLQLWLGGYRIHQIQILKKSAESNHHFFPRTKLIFPLNGGNCFTARSSARLF